MSTSEPTKITTGVSDIFNKLSSMNDSTAVFALSVLNIVILLMAIMVYLYYTGTIFSKGLRERDCKLMTEIYGELNGKLNSHYKDSELNTGTWELPTLNTLRQKIKYSTTSKIDSFSYEILIINTAQLKLKLNNATSKTEYLFKIAN